MNALQGSDLDSEDHALKGPGSGSFASVTASPEHTHTTTTTRDKPPGDHAQEAPVATATTAESWDSPEPVSPKLAAAEARVAELTAERDALQGQVSKGRRSLAASEGSSTNLARAVGTRESECDMLRKQIDQLVSRMEEETQKHEAVVTQLIEENSVLQAQAAVLTKDDADSDKLSELKAVFEAAMQQKDELLEETVTQREVGDALVADLSRQLEDSRRGAGEAGAAYGASLEGLEARLAEGETAAAAQDAEVARLNALLEEAREAASTAAAAGQEGVDEDLQTQIKDLSFQLSSATSQLTAIVGEKKAGDARVAELAEALADLEARHGAATEAGAAREAVLEGALLDKESARQDIEYAAVRLKALLGEAREDMSAEQEKVSSLKSKLVALRAEVLAAEEAAEQSRAAHEYTLESAADLGREVESLSAQVRGLEEAALVAPAVPPPAVPPPAVPATAPEDEAPTEDLLDLMDSGAGEEAAARAESGGDSDMFANDIASDIANDIAEGGDEDPVSASVPIHVPTGNHGPFNLSFEAALSSYREGSRKAGQAGEDPSSAANQALLLSYTEEAIASLRRALQQMEQSNAEEVVSLQGVVLALQAQIGPLKEQRETSAARAETLRTALEEEITGLRAELYACQGQLIGAESDLSLHRDKIAALCAQLTASQTDLAHLTASSALDICNMKTLLLQAAGEDKLDDDQIVALEGRLRVLERDSLAAAAAGEEHDAESAAAVASMKTTCESLRRQLAQLEDLKHNQATLSKSEIEALNQRLEERDELHDQLQLAIKDEVATLKGAAEASQLETEALREDVSSLRKAKLRDQDGLRALEEAAERLALDLAAARKQVAAAVAEAEGAREEAAAAARKTSQLQADKELLAEEVFTLRSTPPALPPPPVPTMPAGESMDDVEMGGDAEEDGSSHHDMVKLRSELRESHTEVGRLQDLYMDVCSRLEDVQSEAATAQARREVASMEQHLGTDADAWLGELISTKVLAANAATELDMQKQNAKSLKKTIQQYSARITALETELIAARGSDARAPAPEKNKMFKRPTVKGFKLPGTGKKEVPDAKGGAKK
jgi:chromosome segregation ATPase